MFGRRRRQGNQASAEKTAYASYDEALAVCGHGYHDHNLTRVNFERDRGFYYAATFPDVPWYMTAGIAAALPICFMKTGRALRVLDFGGSVGIHHVFARKNLPFVPIEKWAVVETAGAVASGRELETETFCFFEEIADANAWLGAPDLVTTSGAVHCTPDPLRTVQILCSLGAAVFAMHRCAFALDEEVVTIQRSKLSDNARGPMPPGIANEDVRYPLTLLRENTYRARVEEHYRLLMKLPDEQPSIFNDMRVALRGVLLFELSAKAASKQITVLR